MLRSIKANEQKPVGPFHNAGKYRDMTTMKMLNLSLDPGPEKKKKKEKNRKALGVTIDEI